jgi:hypothetical protein
MEAGRIFAPSSSLRTHNLPAQVPTNDTSTPKWKQLRVGITEKHQRLTMEAGCIDG